MNAARNERKIDIVADDSPLNQYDYDPAVKPYRGSIPPIVQKWGPRSQIRWFYRFRPHLDPRPEAEWMLYHVQSMSHRGLCCSSCIEDVNEGYEPYDPDLCCCIGERVNQMVGFRPEHARLHISEKPGDPQA